MVVASSAALCCEGAVTECEAAARGGKLCHLALLTDAEEWAVMAVKAAFESYLVVTSTR